MIWSAHVVEQAALDGDRDRRARLAPRQPFEPRPVAEVLARPASRDRARRSPAGSRPARRASRGDSKRSLPSTVTRPLGRRQEAGDHADGRRLAGAVRPQHAEDLPFPHGKGDAVDGGEVAVAAAQVLRFDHERPSLDRPGPTDPGTQRPTARAMPPSRRAPTAANYGKCRRIRDVPAAAARETCHFGRPEGDRIVFRAGGQGRARATHPVFKPRRGGSRPDPRRVGCRPFRAS